jgi:glycine betaine/proline transport system permease protein
MSNFVPKVPLAEWVDFLVDWLTDNAEWFFDPIRDGLKWFVDTLSGILVSIPSIIFILLITLLAFFISKRNIGLTGITLIGFLFIDNLGYWEGTMLTLTLVLTASMLSIIIGVPIGIWMSRSKVVEDIFKPILDFMQTMPAFVYLIPAVTFFGIGMVPGVIASVIFSMPPTVRLTNLGIQQVPKELIEASEAFGSTSKQKLYKVQLPLAKTTIMAGVNQTIMLALSMVVIASMIGADGLGTEVYRAITRNEAGQGFESGLAIVILAIVLDRITQNLYSQKY